MAGAMEFMNAMAGRWAGVMWPAVWQSAHGMTPVLLTDAGVTLYRTTRESDDYR